MVLFIQGLLIPNDQEYEVNGDFNYLIRRGSNINIEVFRIYAYHLFDFPNQVCQLNQPGLLFGSASSGSF